MVLSRRIARDLKENMMRSIAMLLIIAMSMAFVGALCSAADSITEAVRDEWKKCLVEDGSFETYTPLSKRNMNELSKVSATVERMFYTDIPLSGGAVLRIFRNRTKINLAYIEEGRLPKDGEIFIEKIFAKNHGLKVGSKVKSGETELTVSGVGCLPDYGYVKQSTGDVAANDEFSVAIVSDGDFERLRAGKKTVFCYAYRLGSATAKELKDALLELDIDKTMISDTYIKAQAEKPELMKERIFGITGAIKGGAMEISEAARQAKSDSLGSAATGIYAAADALEGEISESFSQKFETVNISSFGEAKYNIRITNAIDDSKIGKQAALVVGAFLLILLVYMLAVFASGTIERERPVIGTLYALGYKRPELLSHYMKIPLLISAVGGISGLALGYALTGAMAASYSAMYSFPPLKRVFPMYLNLYSTLMPTAFSYIINRAVLSKKLAGTPLSMMQEDKNKAKAVKLRIARLSFSAKYKIRQFFRELSGNITLFFGINISLIIIMFAVACYGSLTSYSNSITDDVRWNYMYILKNPVTDLPKNPSVGYARGFYTDFYMTGGEMEVSLLGIGNDNPYFDFAPELGDNVSEVYMSDSARLKFGYSVGDRVVFRDPSEDKLYAFTIAGEVKYGSGLYFFMNLDTMRKAFGLEYFDENDLKRGERRPSPESYYYNTVFSDSPLTFGHNMTVSEIKKADMKSGADKFITLMWDMIILMSAVAVIVFAAVVYLLMKLEIDRSSYSVSLLKALGYSEKTVNSFYLAPSLWVMAAATVLGVPMCSEVVRIAYPFCVSNVNAGFEAIITPGGYAIVLSVMWTAYLAVLFALKRRLSKISIDEILKNRE